MQMTLDISEEQAAKLDELSAQRNASREALLSEALDLLLRQTSPTHAELSGVTPALIRDPEERRQILLQSFGALPHLEDGQAFQDRLRNEWVREWDPEFDPTIHG